MKVFLSGKVDPVHGAWRNALLGGSAPWEIRVDVPEWDAPPEDAVAPWPVRRGAVLGLMDYVGPYRQVYKRDIESKNTGVFREVMVPGQHGWPHDAYRGLIAERCRRAIADADIVFAYINTLDAYGTLLEIGYARALGKFVALLFGREVQGDERVAIDDYWFACEMVSYECDWPGTVVAGETWEPASESAAVAACLRDAVLHYTVLFNPGAQRPPQPSAPADTTVLREVTQSLSQIARWSADPRVRGEAQRMLTRLSR